MHEYSTNPLTTLLTNPERGGSIVNIGGHNVQKNVITILTNEANQSLLKAIKACGDAQVARAGAGDGSLTLLQNVINDLHGANAALGRAAQKLRDWKN
jgi:hypothetical protein